MEERVEIPEVPAAASNEDDNAGPSSDDPYEEDFAEYKDGDSSDEEELRNTVGNIPMDWYKNYPHLGYDLDGNKIMKPKQGDLLDEFIDRMEDPNYWRTIVDPMTGQRVILSKEDVKIIRRLERSKIPDPSHDEYKPWIEWFTSEVMKTPLRKFPEHKRSFLPSLAYKKKINHLVHGIKMGRIKTLEEEERERYEKKKAANKFYMLWDTDNTAEEMRRIRNHIPAPKRHLPSHVESYNPPPEYLLDEEEMKEWESLKDEPWRRKYPFLPEKHKSLREVGAYPKFVKERFTRCLDLYLCPRTTKVRQSIQPEDLLPKLPSPKDLQPFPTTVSLTYKGHTNMVRTISVDPLGQYLLSGSDDCTAKVWEVSTGRCVKTFEVGGVVRSVAWCPNSALSLVAVAADRKLLLINPSVGDFLVVGKTDTLLDEPPEQTAIVAERIKAAVQWEHPEKELWDKGIRIVINHFKEIKQITWHAKGDYFATVMPDGENRSVLIHQLSNRRSQIPFSKSKGIIQCVLFHPIIPYFFVATQRNIRVYDLVKQELTKKLLANSQWISSMAIHPGGDNLIVGTYDKKTIWFDLDLSSKPYKTLRFHSGSVRSVAFHKRYPLMASGSDDKNVIVSHSMVYSDLLQNALIVPLKKLKGHEAFDDFGVFDTLFHPLQPWLFSSGADSTIKLYT
nr:PREDICTED: ribosome biogenesis protein BOP1 homolog [Bemisia tabaci]